MWTQADECDVCRAKPGSPDLCASCLKRRAAAESSEAAARFPWWGEDLVRQAMVLACDQFGGTDGTFNAAGFSLAFCRLAGVLGAMDGKVVRAILSGRPDCVLLPGGAHFRLLPREREPVKEIGVCPVCQEPQFECPGGQACKNGHGF